MKFGRIIARACKSQGVSHSELARRLKVSQPRVQEIIKSPSLTERLFLRCARALDLEVRIQLKSPSRSKLARQRRRRAQL